MTGEFDGDFYALSRYYEYLLKTWLQGGKRDKVLITRCSEE